MPNAKSGSHREHNRNGQSTEQGELSLEQLDEVSGGAAQPTMPIADATLIADASLTVFESSQLATSLSLNDPIDVTLKK
jgi:hypothetical protein